MKARLKALASGLKTRLTCNRSIMLRLRVNGEVNSCKSALSVSMKQLEGQY